MNEVTVDLLTSAVIGPITEDRHLWRINWLKSLLEAIDEGQLAVTDKCEDRSAMGDAIDECRAMVREVNVALADHPQISNS